MEDDIILSRPTDRRLVKDDSNLPPGPPGTENDPYDMAKKDSTPSKKDTKKSNSRDSRRRSPSSPRDRRSRSRSRGKLRSRSRGRDYSPPADRRRFGNNRNRRSRDRSNRSPPERNRTRDRSRSRGRYRSRRSRSRSNSPMKSRWSPMKKPPSPAMPPPPQYTVPQQYDAYGSYNNQYMGQFPAYDYANHTVPLAYPGTYPCDPQTWSQPPPAPPIQQQIAPQPQPVQITTGETEQEQMKRDAAIAQEAQIQRDQLIKQRNDYMKRAAALKREMKILKDQRSDLVSTKAPPSPTTKGFLEENDRLQSQIQKKLSTIENVIDMLSSIIGEEKTSVTPPAVTSGKKAMQKPKSDEDDSSSSSPERLKTKLIESIKSKKDVTKKPPDTTAAIKVEKVKEEPGVKTQDDVASQPTKKINYSFYDPEMHWCITCDVFPKTAKDYLNHLHNEEHAKNSVTPDTPWHENAVNDEFPTYPNTATKRVPIRGLQFFVPSSGWYCKLCNFWMGDLHCASLHLKSRSHWDKYNDYVEQNPHFEVDWMADRQKILDSVRSKEKCAPPPPQITPVVSTSGMDLLESIPLQINNQKLNIDFDRKEKKKKKKEEKKEKKKKKKSKKRKRSSSSSSSSSSVSTSDSDAEKKTKSKEDRANSIRVAMRNLLPKDENTRAKPADGKSISVPAKSIEMVKKDELISQWNTPQPIISESEKKLFENLKGKLKTKTAEEAKKPIIDLTENSKKRDRSPSTKSSSEANRNKSKKTSPDRKERRSGSCEKTKDSRPKNDKSSPSRGGKERSKSRDKTRAKSKSVEKRSGNLDTGRGAKRSRSRDRRSRSDDADRRDRRSRSQDGGRRGRDFDNRRSRSRGRRDRSRNRRGRASPDRRRGRRSRSAKRNSRSPKRSRSRSRRSRSPSNRYGRRKSYSRSRSRSRSRSYRIEKPIVRYPEFRPRVPPPTEGKKAKKSEADTDGKKTPPPKKPTATQAPGGKKLPFIGRMPVFKKQTQGGEGDKKDGENMDEYNAEYMMAMGYDHYEMGMMDYDDLMPDPMQYVSLMGAPPPPPSAPPPGEDEADMLPPGIDESEADTVPKPISDGPRPRKGPLPKDFQEALNIIFPGERRPDEEAATVEKVLKTNGEGNAEPNTTSKPSTADETAADANSPNTDDTSQQSSGEAFLGFPTTAITTGTLSDLTQDVPDIASLVAAVPPPPPPPLPEHKEEDTVRKAGKDEPAKTDEKTTKSVKDNSSSSPTDQARRQEELDDLAMLGIDADDLAAQCM